MFLRKVRDTKEEVLSFTLYFVHTEDETSPGDRGDWSPGIFDNFTMSEFRSIPNRNGRPYVLRVVPEVVHLLENRHE